MGEVPDARAPVLQVHVTQPGPGTDEDLDRTAVQARGRRIAAAGLGQQGRFGVLFEDHQAVAQVDSARREGREDVQRLGDGHAAGDVQQRAARPEGRVQRGELVPPWIDDLPRQMRPEQLAVLGDERFQVAEQDAPPAPRGVQLRPQGVAVQGHGASAQVDPFRQQRLRDGRAVSRRRGRTEAVQPEGPQFGPLPLFLAAVGQSHLAEALPGLAAITGEPLGLAPRLQKGREGLVGKARLGGGVDDIAHPTVPSICNWMRRFISTAYSMGSSLTSGSMKPLTIIVLASGSVSPRLVR